MRNKIQFIMTHTKVILGNKSVVRSQKESSTELGMMLEVILEDIQAGHPPEQISIKWRNGSGFDYERDRSQEW